MKNIWIIIAAFLGIIAVDMSILVFEWCVPVSWYENFKEE